MKLLNICILLIGGEVPGGAERRIASFTRHISVFQDLNITLVINNELLDQLILSDLKPICRIVILRSWYFENFFNRIIRKSPKNFIYKTVKRLFKITSNFFLIIQFGIYFLLNRPDVLHLVLGSALKTALPFVFFTKKALVCSVVGSEVRSFHSLGNIDQHVLKWYLKNVNIVDALSEELRGILINEKMAEDSKIRVSDSFVDYRGIQPLALKKNWVVFAARLVNEKNPLLFLDMIPLVISEMGDNVHFFLLGTGDLNSAAVDRIKNYGISQFITTGFNNNIVSILQKSLIFCSLQEYENYPSRSLLEAMVCGNAIVATDVGFTHKLVNEHTGIRVPNAVDELTSAIIYLLKNAEKAQDMGKNARKLVQEEYSPKAYCDKMREIYLEAYNIYLSSQSR
jgi:glycosyltransferase involved in cell wall biosynthesis